MVTKEMGSVAVRVFHDTLLRHPEDEGGLSKVLGRQEYAVSLPARPSLLLLPRLPFKDVCLAGSLMRWHLLRSALLAVLVINALFL